MADFSMFVPNVHFEQIPIKNLVSNQEYQRNISEQHVLNAAAHFDLYQINPVKVSRRNGVNYVFNGQHTVEIVALASGSRDTPVWCMIYDDLNYEHEADIFANQMKFVKPLKPYEVFMANIEAGNQKQLIIGSGGVLLAFHWPSQKLWGGLRCVHVGKHLRQVRLSCSGPDTSALCGHLGGRYEFSLR